MVDNVQAANKEAREVENIAVKTSRAMLKVPVQLRDELDRLFKEIR